jgi:ATP-dependent RNA helicase DDX56/DBP9
MKCGVFFRSATMSDSEEDKKNVLPFHEMGLDDRILKAVAKLGWIEPTLIQVTR